MTRVKRLFSTVDAKPQAMYAKRNIDDEEVYPVLTNEFGNLLISQGISLPSYDQQTVDESDQNNITITYKMSSSVVAVKTIAKSGDVTDITIAYS